MVSKADVREFRGCKRSRWVEVLVADDRTKSVERDSPIEAASVGRASREGNTRDLAASIEGVTLIGSCTNISFVETRPHRIAQSHITSRQLLSSSQPLVIAVA